MENASEHHRQRYSVDAVAADQHAGVFFRFVLCALTGVAHSERSLRAAGTVGRRSFDPVIGSAVLPLRFGPSLSAIATATGLYMHKISFILPNGSNVPGENVLFPCAAQLAMVLLG